MRYRILKNYPNADNWQEGDVVDITDATVLVAQGLVESVEDATTEEVTPVEAENEENLPSAAWKKDELVAYAKAIGVKSSGTKAEILEAIEGGE